MSNMEECIQMCSLPHVKYGGMHTDVQPTTCQIWRDAYRCAAYHMSNMEGCILMCSLPHVKYGGMHIDVQPTTCQIWRDAYRCAAYHMTCGRLHIYMHPSIFDMW